jgi:lysosomal alpha-glucosidase
MWAFGWNQCKFGYYDSNMWWNAYQGYKTFNLPLDTMWGDIDYMDDYKVFTYSQQSYADLPDKVKQIRAEGRQFVPIIDDAIAVRPNQGYMPYEDGLSKGVFVMRKDQSGPTTGGVWPGHAYYPDFFKPVTQQWWFDNLQAFNSKVEFDGIWLDMNEASSTCTGYCYDSERPRDAVKYELPYWPGARDLEVQVLGLDSVYTGVSGPNNTFRTELDLRSLYAIKESQATFNYLKQNNKRPFILSRSNAPGLQKYAFHWLADNWSKEEWLSSSVDSLFEYNLFGIPMMGSDICGFNLEPTAELCTRWHQLGSFYPFSRNHKNSVWKQTEPYQYNFTVPELDDGRTYTDLIRTSLL